MRINSVLGAVLIMLLFSKISLSQQLRLGGTPWAVTKSAVLELQSSNQGLLFSRIADTAQINALNPPDGMVIYFVPTKRMLLRANGAWQSMAIASAIDTTNIPNFYLKVRGLLSAGAGISYNNSTGVISNAGVISLNGNTGALIMDTGYISNYYLKTRSLFSGGTGISYNATTGAIGNSGVLSVNGNTGALTMDTGYISNFYVKVRGLFSSTAPITLNNGQIGITQASATTNGFLSSADWNNFNNKLASIDTTSISNFYLKVRSLFSAGTGITYNSTTGTIGNGGVLSLNGNTGALTMDTGYISNFYLKTRGLLSAGTGISYNAVTGVISATGGSNNWLYNGNTVGSLRTIGTIDNFDFPIITNNVERMRITAAGRVGIGVTNPGNPLVVKDTMEIRRTGALSTLLFTNTASVGDFRIGGDGGDLFWQGGGGRNLQMGSFWTTILMGDRQSGTFPAFSPGNNLNVGVLIPAARDNSVPLAIQANSASQTANLTEWRNSAGTIMSVVDDIGSVAIGAATFNASNPERLLVDAGTTGSFNVISGKGTINNYLQLNIQNRSNGGTASSDLVATADNGTETANFVNLGINSSGFTGTEIMGGANNAYLYSTGNDFVIGNATASRNLRLFTGGTAAANERLRIDANGLVGINTTAPSTTLHIRSGIANDAGLRLENLTSASPVAPSAAVLGVDATGKVVRARTPAFFSGTGASATVDAITKVWVAEVANVAGGIQTVTIPANVAFSAVLNIQVTAKGGSSVTTAPIAMVTSNTTSQVVIRVLESANTAILLGGTVEGLEAHSDVNTRIYIRVEGN